MTRSDRIAQALTACIVDAPEEDQAELFAALRAFREEVSRTYAGVRKQPFAARMIDAIIDAEDEVTEMTAEYTEPAKYGL